MDQEERKKLVELAIRSIEKKHGQGTVFSAFNPINKKKEIDSISSGSIALDLAVGNGGWPRGRIIELFGPESSGKSTLCLHLIAETQRIGGIAAYIDAENAFDWRYADALGINVDDLILVQPDSAEQAFDVVEALLRSGGVDVVIIDSIAALVPKAELEEDSFDDNHVGVMARLMSKAMRKLTPLVSKANAILFCVNQVRSNIGPYAASDTTPGGRSLRFFSSVRCKIRQIEKVHDSHGRIVAIRSHVEVVKNKAAPPWQEAEFEIEFMKGISKIGEIIDLGVELAILDKRGAWYYYGDQRLGQGRENVKAFLTENPEIAQEIENKIRSVFNTQIEETENSDSDD